MQVGIFPKRIRLAAELFGRLNRVQTVTKYLQTKLYDLDTYLTMHT